MLGTLGKAKPAAKKALVNLSTKQVGKVVTNLSAKSSLTTAQQARLDRARNVLAKRGGGTTTTGGGPTVLPTFPTFPTEAPPPGHRWVYNATTNAYEPQAIPLDTMQTINYTGGWGGGSGSGWGGAAPDFSVWGGAGDTSMWGPAPAAPAPGVNPLDSALATADGSAPGAGLSGKTLLIGAAVIGGAWWFLKGRKRGGK